MYNPETGRRLPHPRVLPTPTVTGRERREREYENQTLQHVVPKPMVFKRLLRDYLFIRISDHYVDNYYIMWYLV